MDKERKEQREEGSDSLQGQLLLGDANQPSEIVVVSNADNSHHHVIAHLNSHVEPAQTKSTPVSELINTKLQQELLSPGSSMKGQNHTRNPSKDQELNVQYTHSSKSAQNLKQASQECKQTNLTPQAELNLHKDFRYTIHTEQESARQHTQKMIDTVERELASFDHSNPRRSSLGQGPASRTLNKSAHDSRSGKPRPAAEVYMSANQPESVHLSKMSRQKTTGVNAKGFPVYGKQPNAPQSSSGRFAQKSKTGVEKAQQNYQPHFAAYTDINGPEVINNLHDSLKKNYGSNSPTRRSRQNALDPLNSGQVTTGDPSQPQQPPTRSQMKHDQSKPPGVNTAKSPVLKRENSLMDIKQPILKGRGASKDQALQSNKAPLVATKQDKKTARNQGAAPTHQTYVKDRKASDKVATKAKEGYQNESHQFQDDSIGIIDQSQTGLFEAEAEGHEEQHDSIDIFTPTGQQAAFIAGKLSSFTPLKTKPVERKAKSFMNAVRPSNLLIQRLGNALAENNEHLQDLTALRKAKAMEKSESSYKSDLKSPLSLMSESDESVVPADIPYIEARKTVGEIKQKESHLSSQFTVSQIHKEYKQLSKQERQDHSSELINVLGKGNEAYFRGKQLRFENAQSYCQCVQIDTSGLKDAQGVNPKSLITLQRIKKRSEAFRDDTSVEELEQVAPRQFFAMTQELSEEQQVFSDGQNQPPSIPLAEFGPCEAPVWQSDANLSSDLSLIAIWTPDESGQYQSSRPLPVFNLLKRPVNLEIDAEQGLFTAPGGKVLFFNRSQDDQRLVINVLSLVPPPSDEHSQPQRRLTGETKQRTSQVDLLTGQRSLYRIAEESFLEKQLIYQLLKHKKKPEITISLPAPTLVTLSNGKTYLVITTLSEPDKMPSVSFFDLPTQADGDNETSHQESTIQDVSGEAAYCIEGAELFLCSETNGSDIMVLINQSLMRPQSQTEADFARLTSPTVVLTVKSDQLEQLAFLKKQRSEAFDSEEGDSRYYKEVAKLLESLPSQELEAHGSVMSLFRGLSHSYPYTEAVYHQKMHSLTLRFHGSKTKASKAVAFNCVDKSARALRENKTELSGLYLNKDDEQVQIKAFAKGQNLANEYLSAESSGSEVRGRSFKVKMEVHHTEWVTGSNLAQNQGKNRLPFTLTDLVIDTKSGLITSGLANIEGERYSYSLVPVEQAESQTSLQSAYPGEQPFKLLFRSNALIRNARVEERLTIATIEGTMFNKPLMQRLTGQLRMQKPSGELLKVNFVLQKRTQATVWLEFETHQVDFDCEISGGEVHGKGEKLTLKHQAFESNLFDHAHIIVKDDFGTFVLHGSLQRLLLSAKARADARTGPKYENTVKLTQVHRTKSTDSITQLKQKVIELQLQRSLISLLSGSQFKTQNGVVQDVIITQTPLQVTLATLQSAQTNLQSTIRFIHEQISEGKASTEQQADSHETVSGPLGQTIVADYPLLAYNSVMPDNSQIVLTNMACKHKQQQVLSLGQWSFISFVQSVNQSGALKLAPNNYQVYFLAKHRTQNKVRLLVAEQDAWASQTQPSIILHVVKSGELKLPPPSRDLLRGVHLLVASKSTYTEPQMALLFQYEDSLWSVSLASPETPASLVLEPQQHGVMAKRRIVSRINDQSHVYCLAASSQKDLLLRIGLPKDSELGDKLEVTAIFESHSSRFVVLEADIENAQNLFVVDDEQRVIKLSDAEEGKATTLSVYDLSEYELEDELALVQEKPWTSLAVSDRVLTIDNFSFSLHIKFFWQSIDSVDGRHLIEERNLPGSLTCLQQWVSEDGSSLLICKPHSGVPVVDLIGQYRTNEKTLVYLASDKTVLVSSAAASEDIHLTLFDQDGYLIQDPSMPTCLSRPQKVIDQSVWTEAYGKFFLLKDPDDVLTLLQSDNQGFSQLLGNICAETIFKQICHQQAQTSSLIELLPAQKGVSGLASSLEANFQKTFTIHEHLMMVSKRGELVILASVVLTPLDESLTTLSSADPSGGKGVHSDSELDDHSGYQSSGKIVGLVTFNRVKVVLFACNSDAQQNILGRVARAQGYSPFENAKTENKAARQKYELTRRISVFQSLHQSKSDKRLNVKIEKQSVQFGLIDSKLVWIDISSKQVQFIDLDALKQVDHTQGKSASCRCAWTKVDCRAFTVRQVLSHVRQEEIRLHGISIDEVEEFSTIRQKQASQLLSIGKDGPQNASLMQLTVGLEATVFLLGKTNRQEVDMIHQLNDFKEPLALANTGFSYNLKAKCMQANSSATLGIERPCPSQTSGGLYRAFSELDIVRVISLSAVLDEQKGVLPQSSKTDQSAIELGTLLRNFGGETIFSLFSDQASVYESIYEQVKELLQAEVKQNDASFLRALFFVMDRPTRVTVQENKHLTDLSILRQSLLFSDLKARISVFRLANLLGMRFQDCVSCIGDLQLVLDSLPRQQYTRVLNSLGRNVHTQTINEAVMVKRGDNAEMSTFIQASAVISDYTPELGLHRAQVDDEVKRTVLVRLFPLHWIHAEKGTEAEVFKFFRLNLDKLQGSLLLNAMFQAFWDKQQRKILKYGFYPYLAYFLVVLFYYLECLMMDFDSPVGIWQDVCSISGQDEADCDYLETYEPILRYILLVFIAHEIFIEGFQLYKDGSKAYFSQWINRLDVMTLVLNCAVVGLIYADADLLKVRVVASAGIVLLWVQMFFWFRLFDSLAQYVGLILSTIYDIRHFMYVLASLMFMFQCGSYMVQLNRMSAYETDDVYYRYDPDRGNGLLGASLLNQYLMLLGSFDVTLYDRSIQSVDDQAWIWMENNLNLAYFVCAQFFTQIVVLNMLIAIMGATFDRHSEDREANGKRQKLLLQAEFVKLLDFYNWLCRCRCGRSRRGDDEQATAYLFVVTPLKKESSDDDFQGGEGGQSGNNSLAVKALDEKFRDLNNFLNKKMLRGLQDLAEETRLRLDQVEKTTVDKMEAQKAELTLKLVKLKDDVREQQAESEKRIKAQATKNHRTLIEAMHRVELVSSRR